MTLDPALLVELRPELHRYCARMTGSVFDGEDIVQEAITKAHVALGAMTEPPNLRPWLFRIAHNTAMDFLRRYERKNVDIVAEVPDRAEARETSVDPVLVEAALGVFMALPASQRGALILKDVLGHSLEEVATTLGTTVSAVKATLSRARANIHPRVVPTAAGDIANLQRYVDLFNNRDWDGLRALLTEEAHLDLVSRTKRRAAEAQYYFHYAEIMKTETLRAEAGFADGIPAIAVFRAPSTAPAYFVLLEWQKDRVTLIRDFRYVPYIADGARFRKDRA